MFDHLGEIALYSFAIIAGIQICYYLFIFSRVAFYSRKFDQDQPPAEKFSVIICAKDEELNLQRNLPAVLQQRFHHHLTPEYEVIVVNDNSEDDSRYYLRSIEPGYPHYRTIEIKQPAKFIPGKKFPLSMGLRGAAHENVLLTDADCKPASTYWLSLMSQGFTENKEIVLGYGAYHKKPGFLNKVIRYETYFSALQHLSFAMSGMAYMGVGRNLAYKRELFYRHKGFTSHQHLAGGDDDLFVNTAANRKNVGVVIHKKAFTYSEPKTSWSSWFRQKTRHMTTGKHYRFFHKMVLGLFSLTHFLFYPAFIFTLFFPAPLLWYSLGIFGGKLLIQAIINFCAMRKLDERDLFKYAWFMDIFMLLYYVVFTPALLIKSKNRW
ncbi:Glycosyltransferase, catalytic subunit of cellulose synthase and poly-beta-1,6-N-acetylglucosamine synthase [Chitinophaga jiangningensis]|uniref:Glycosyltransferase, catalytic subunit of cellulose synthase and poly-beta-1,6-N-acetylglucosamine synthase n=1 Tax=Chitinophaga jiangningensis TaxID=1419482 RepID=A0A1M6W090_9BACT|nr:glycosyltransferase [Chitinophaga jiangningensis]SHK87182.1 Glycosyltransferase, catalytic subunit of cellulose synthase and poly-beta-1,6-N-acetylglucosamine synthase [Chitinophaga jiangningensis]